MTLTFLSSPPPSLMIKPMNPPPPYEKEKEMGKTQKLKLEIKAPSFFRCPISLEVMRSPVSLCTGVTYDRSSIQRWLDSGNATCPATMLPLPTTDLIPNHTLRRLINIWLASKGRENYDFALADLVKDIRSAGDPSLIVEKLGEFFRDGEIDGMVKNGLIGDFASVVCLIVENSKGIEIVSSVLDSDWIEDGNKEILISALCSDVGSILGSLISALREGNKLESRKNSARILQVILPSSKSKILASEKLDALITELTLLISNPSAMDDALKCVIELLHSKRAVKSLVEAKLVQTLIKILSPKSPISSKEAENAIIIMEAVANYTVGRASINVVAEDCVRVLMERMMKVGKRGREAAIGILWGVCFDSSSSKCGVGRRAKEEVAAASRGMAKILMVMQGDCSSAVRRMGGDLLRVFRVDAKSLVQGYDTKTTHIMPF